MKNGAAELVRYRFGDFQLDLEERLLHRPEGPPIALTPRVFETLRYLVEHPGRVLEKEVLMDAVWPDSVVEENNLAQNISTLRRFFGDRPGAQRYIATVPGRGYRFLPEVRTESGPRAPAASLEPARPRAAEGAATPAPPAQGRA